MVDELDELEIKISRLNSLSENCRLDIAVPFSIGIVRTIDILYNRNVISRKEYDRMNNEINNAVNKSYRCVCIHPLSIFA